MARRTLNQDIEFHTAWLLMRDKEFLKQNAKLPAAIFPRGPLRYLVDLALLNWEATRSVLSATIVNVATANDPSGLRKNQTDAARVIDVFNDLENGYAVDAQSIVAVRKYARQWLEQKLLSTSIDRASDAYNRGDLTRARSLLDHSRLADDDLRESVGLESTTADFLSVSRTIAPGALPTGFKQLDDAWDGGYRKQEIGLILAPTGIGKSMMLSFLASQAFWSGADILYYTYELTVNQIRDRIALAILGKGVKYATRPWKTELKDAASTRGVAVPTSKIDVRGGDMTWPDLEADLEEYKLTNGKYPDLLILDSADDIRPMNPERALHEQLKTAYTRLRSIAKQKGIAIWSSGQLNRESVEKARVNLKQIADAFAKAQRVHYVLAFTQTQREREDPGGAKMHMYVLKDSLYGTTGADFELKPYFGPGNPKDSGYPGFFVELAEHLPS